MNKKRVIIVEADENYISNLEMILISHEESLVNIELITDMEYLRTFMSNPQIIDCLIIDEEMLTDETMKQNIGHIFVLSERMTRNYITASSQLGQNDTTARPFSLMRSATKTEYIDKYGTVNELFQKIIGALNLPSDDRVSRYTGSKSSADTIMVTSQLGGVGKTRIAFSLALRLAELNRKVLYISLDQIQRNHIHININEYIEDGIERFLFNRDSNIVSLFDKMTYRGIFDYFLPWNSARSSLGLDAEHYIFLIEMIKSVGRYDFIILDDNGSFDEFSQELMGVCDRIINVMVDNKTAEMAFSAFENEIRSNEQEKIICVINRTVNSTIEHINEESSELVSEYMFYNDNWLDDLGKTSIMKDTAMLLV